MSSISKFSDKYRFLSNLYPTTIYYGKEYKSVEHAYQANKTLDPIISEEIRNCKTPEMAKRAGYHIQCRSDWGIIRIPIMRSLLMIKFAQPDLSEQLIKTWPHDLIDENSYGDVFWGICKNKGRNILGKLLCQIRWILKCSQMVETPTFPEAYKKFLATKAAISAPETTSVQAAILREQAEFLQSNISNDGLYYKL